MNKFNRRFNQEYARFNFWHSLTINFSDLLEQLQRKDFFTPEDVNVLFSVHALLFECYKRVNVQKNFHSDRLKKLREDV